LRTRDGDEESGGKDGDHWWCQCVGVVRRGRTVIDETPDGVTEVAVMKDDDRREDDDNQSEKTEMWHEKMEMSARDQVVVIATRIWRS